MNSVPPWSGRRETAGGEATAAGDAMSQMDALQPELIAPLVVHLCTDAASNVNGRDFIVGGNEISLCSLPGRERAIFRDGGWTLDALDEVFAATIGAAVRNPMPAQPAKN